MVKGWSKFGLGVSNAGSRNMRIGEGRPTSGVSESWDHRTPFRDSYDLFCTGVTVPNLEYVSPFYVNVIVTARRWSSCETTLLYTLVRHMLHKERAPGSHTVLHKCVPEHGFFGGS